MAKKVCLVGSGNWGSAIARIIGENTQRMPDAFERDINMWVFEEQVNGRRLTEIINTEHENVKYLPGYKLPTNIIAVPELIDAVRDADILIFCVPHQFLGRMLPTIKPTLKPHAIAVSLIKGIDFDQHGVVLISDRIRQALDIDCSVLMGANVANEVAAGDFCESTLGCSDLRHGALLQDLFHTSRFHVAVALDPHGVEICGALKNVIALGAGFCDGLNYGGNTKAAIIRIGLMEMKKFCFKYFDGIKEETFFESCGIADLITTCFGGRNRKCAQAFITTGKSWEQLEQELLNGQKLQGTLTCLEVMEMLKKQQCEEQFPLFTNIYKIAFEGADPTLISQL